VNKYRRIAAWILGPIAALFLGFTVFAAITDFVAWLPPLVATVVVLVSGTVVWVNLGKAPR
jgi:hypothetical protein